MEKPILNVTNLEDYLRLDSAAIVLIMVGVAWGIYKILMRQLSHERHRLLMKNFGNLFFHTGLVAVVYGILLCLRELQSTYPMLSRFYEQFGLFTVAYGLLVVVKTCRMFIFEYLFLSHMKVPVPILLVNLFTSVLALVIGFWALADIMNVHLTPVLATSAVFSLVLGLALQDTLGNLFAGIALQLDKSYQIGDWIEVNNAGQKHLGQIREITWRATTLTSFTDEILTVPNRIMSQSQLSNFSSHHGPVIRGHTFRFAVDTNLPAAKDAMLKAIRGVKGVCADPVPIVLVVDTTESWIATRLVYWIVDFGNQFSIGDGVFSAVLSEIQRSGIQIASNRLEIKTLTQSE